MPVLGQTIEETWRPPVMAQAWNTSAPLELIRFAAANRLCVNLTYQDSRRLIEPYSLRRTREGNLVLYAVKHLTSDGRSYRVDRIQGATVTKEPFVPRYAIELTPSGPISAPPTMRRSTGISGTNRRASSRILNFGPKYIFRCSICGKRFSRNSYNASLNPHKNKQRYPCPGRTGLYVTTRYG